MRNNKAKTLRTTFLLLWVTLYACSEKPKHLDTSLNTAQRVDALVEQMTLDEKISQTMNGAAAIERLGVKEYNWWNEGLHGVGWAGEATSFPQAIALAASFDTALVYAVSDAISTEFRAKFNLAQSNKDYGMFKGLTVWSPNINIFRDPRWGRGQETYGEDPFLTARMGVAFVKGLQGNNTTYYKTIATPKHYAVHSGPESERHKMDIYASEYDFADTYAPAFEACIKEAKAGSIMGAYTRFKGKACCANPFLLDTILRKKWGFKGFVVSDCGAILDIYENHKVVKTPAEAAALAIKSGTDLECGEVYKNLTEAVSKKLVSESTIDSAVKRLFHARFKLGLFDPPANNPWAKLGSADVCSPQNTKLALNASHKAMVLLKNENNTLPLSKNINKIAVIGPNADKAYVLLGNYNGYPKTIVTPLNALQSKLGKEKVLYAQGLNYVGNDPVLETVPTAWLSYKGKPGLRASYFGNTDLKDSAIFQRTDTCINFEWDATPPAQNMSTINFSVRWEGEIIIPESGEYMLSFTGDDGYRIFIADTLLFQDWKVHGIHTHSFILNFEKNKAKKVKLEFYQGVGAAIARFKIGKTSRNYIKEALDIASKSDAILFFGGLTAQIEGEEMDLNIDGFKGGDRTKLSLPEAQINILKELKKLKKPVILVLMNGSALALNWENENIPAILESWYPGQEGGTAIADVLFGDYNPAGRLPITFYKSENDLPPFSDYSMKNRTYRYFTGEPLFPFGYGLSYAKFEYSNLKIENDPQCNTVKIHVKVSNTGNFDGEEVVQLYISAPETIKQKPLRSLKAFKRIMLKHATSKEITFVLIPNDFNTRNPDGSCTQKTGNYTISVGGGQPLEKFKNQNHFVTSSIRF